MAADPDRIAAARRMLSELGVTIADLVLAEAVAMRRRSPAATSVIESLRD